MIVSVMRGQFIIHKYKHSLIQVGLFHDEFKLLLSTDRET